MQDNVNKGSTAAPMLFPYEPAQFWQSVRQIVRLTYKPLFKITEVCSMFQVCRQTIYDWIKDGRLKPYKIKSRVYFLWNDIQQLLKPEDEREGRPGD